MMKKKNIKKILAKSISILEEKNSKDSETKKSEFALFKLQLSKVRFAKTDHYVNNKYVSFKKKTFVKLKPLPFSNMSVMFYELKQDIPVECIIFFEKGYLKGFEVYSCDGTIFESVNLDEIKVEQVDINYRLEKPE